jgi:hypothetical protein
MTYFCAFGAFCERKRKDNAEAQSWQSRTEKGDKDEERFLSAQVDHFTGVKWKEKASACFVRNDDIGGESAWGR